MAARRKKGRGTWVLYGALGQFHAFKELYRNAVMHVRADYDEFQALRAIHQVRDFMNGLSEKIGEKTRRPIRKWP